MKHFSTIFLILGLMIIGLPVMADTDPNGWAERTLASMTLDEKIGQLFIVTAFSDPDLLRPTAKEFFEKAVKDAGLSYKWNEYGGKEFISEVITQFGIGGVIFMSRGRSVSQLEMTNHFQRISKYPLFIAQDNETGLGDHLTDAIRFPHAMALGAIADENLLYEFGREVGNECQVLGVNMNYSPVVDVNIDYRNPVIHMRSFGEDKEKVSSKAIAYMKGMQEVGVVACAKHFPGHGDTHVDSHYDLPHINKTLEELERIELYPFNKMIEAGVRSIMTAHLEVPALEPQPKVASSLSRSIVTDLLRNKMKFEGLIITDALVMQGVTRYHKSGELELKALQAGNDILLCPTHIVAAIEAIKGALADGCLSFKELDEHVLRILKAKEQIMNHGGFKSDLTEETLEHVRSEKAKALKDTLYAQAVTLCGSESDLPRPGTSCGVIQVNSERNDAFWTVLEPHVELTKAIAILKPLNDEDCQQVTHHLGDVPTVIISIHNIDYHNHKTYGIDSGVHQLIKDLQEQGKKVITVLFGTPYSLRRFQKTDTVIIGYEDDESSYRVVADIIAGKRQPVGVLPVTDLRA